MSTSQRCTCRRPISRRHLMRTAAVGAAGAAALSSGLFPMAPAPAAAQEKTAVTFWKPGGSGAGCAMHQSIAQAFTDSQADVAVTMECGSTDEQVYMETLLARIAAGNPPDGAMLWTSPIALGSRGALVPLDELMAASEHCGLENWPEGVLASCQWNGQTYGLPATAGPMSIWYNMDLLDAKGIPSDRESFPKTWDELRELSKEFTVIEDGRVASAGFIPWQDQYTLPIWSALNGGQIYDAANQTYTIDSDTNVEMMEYALAWLDEEYGGDMDTVNNSASWSAYIDDEGQPPAFQEGRQLALESGMWLTTDFYLSFNPSFSNWNVAPFPVGPSGGEAVSGYWPVWVAIPAASALPGEAFRFIDYVVVDGMEIWYTTIPEQPANLAAPTDILPTELVAKRGEAFAQDVSEFYRAQLEVATEMWQSPIQNFEADTLGRALEQIYAKAASPQDALAEAQVSCQNELERTLSDIA